jgi:hypothetical protein
VEDSAVIAKGKGEPHEALLLLRLLLSPVVRSGGAEQVLWRRDGCE